jgi:hypothetical protein
MAQPVWVLSVDLQTKTATFQSGMADAARSARESFQEIKSGANEMGRATSGSMMEARHGVMLLGEEFGVHLPRALTTFIASIGPIGAAMEAAFPFLAIIVGATLLLEHLAKLKQAGETLTESQTKFGTVAANVLNEWSDKILQAGIETDKLNGNHLGALNKTLELIDHQSMKELVQSFDTVAKAADATFADLKTHWYQWDAGSAGAKASLEKFKVQYDALLAVQDSKGGTALLDAKIEREERILALQKQAQDNQTRTGTGGTHQGDYNKFEGAKIALQKMGVGYSEDEVKAQAVQVGALKDLVDLEAKRAELVKAQSTNAQKTEQNRGEGDQDKVAREQAQSAKQAQEEAEKLWEENYRRAVAALQENEREKIDATKEGSAARLQAIDAAIKEEESKGLQDNGFYRGLLTSRVELTRQMADEQAKLTADAGKEAAEHAEKMGELQVEADKNAAALRMSSHRVTDAERVAAEQQTADAEFRVQQQATEKEIAALDKGGKDYENKLKALQDKEIELTQAHEDKITAIKEKAEEQRNARVLAAEQRADDAIARSFEQMVTRHERAGKALIGLGDQVAMGMIQNAIKSILADDMTKEHDAAAAARKAYLAGMHFPFPVNLVMAPTLGAMAFASVMAFETGGIVPGTANTDSVHAMLTPGEAVLPKNLTDNLRSAARSGNMGQSGEVHVHIHQTNHVQALDSEGMDRVLDAHKDRLTQHFNDHVRKMNG